MVVYVSELEREDLPQVVGPYLLVDLLGTGGMGRVFRARSITEQGGMREHAIKALRDDVDTENRRAMFVREARIGRLLQHENLVTTQDYFVAGEERFLVMELVEGANLTALVEGRMEPLPPTDACALVAQVARGLHAIHCLRDEDGELYGLVHRDMKPDNILVRSDGLVKVADFGVAKPTRIDMTAYVTEAADAGPTGTLPYMSPEQVRAQPLDGRSDIWAMGCILYYAMTGRRLFGGDAALGILLRILKLDFEGEADPFGRIDRLLPGAGSVMKKCVALDVNARFPDAEQLARALDFLAAQSTERRTLALISGENLPDWMGVALEELEDPRTAQLVPLESEGSAEPAPEPALRPLGDGGVQGELSSRAAVVMKVIPMRRPTPRPQPARPTPVAQPKPPPPRQVAAPAPPPPEPAADPTRSRRIRGLERRRETARKDQRLWLVVAGAACFLLLVVLFVVFALSVES